MLYFWLCFSHIFRLIFFSNTPSLKSWTTNTSNEAPSKKKQSLCIQTSKNCLEMFPPTGVNSASPGCVVYFLLMLLLMLFPFLNKNWTFSLHIKPKLSFFHIITHHVNELSNQTILQTVLTINVFSPETTKATATTTPQTTSNGQAT